MSAEGESLSYERRKGLRDADSSSIISVLNTFPLEKYYGIADRLLAAFLQAFNERKTDEAYIYGVRFATFSIDSLPKHAKYTLLKTQRSRNSLQVDDVLKKLQIITKRMDAEEMIKAQNAEKAREAAQNYQASLHSRDAEPFSKEELSKRQSEIKQSAHAKLAAMVQKQPSHEKKDPDSRRPRSEGRNHPGAIVERERIENETTTLDSVYTSLPAKGNETKLCPKDATLSRRKSIEHKSKILDSVYTSLPAIPRSENEKETETKVCPKDATLSRIKSRATLCAKATSKKMISMMGKAESTQSRIGPKPKGCHNEQLPRSHSLQLCSSESRTIKMLQETIDRQEERLQDFATRKIPTLSKQAVTSYRAGDRKTALHYMARKKRLENHVDALRGAMFTMETQIFLLESEVEDKEVASAMEAASLVMESLQSEVGSVEIQNLSSELNEEMSSGTADALALDEDCLIKELEDLTKDKGETIHESDDDIDALLSLPNVPSDKMTALRESQDGDNVSVDGLLKAILG